MVSGKEKGYYDIVLMDLQMPVMDGYDSTVAIRKIKMAEELPILAMTADVMQGIREKCTSIGMQGFVMKPIDLDELFGTLVSWIPEMEVSSSQSAVGSRQSDERKKVDVLVPEFELIDVEAGLARVGGNASLLLKLLTKFKAFGTAHYDEIISEHSEGTQEVAIRLAHTLKGVAGNLGINEVFEASKLVESDLNNGSLKDESITRLRESVDAVLEDLKNLSDSAVHNTQSTSTASVKLDDVLEKLSRLKELLEDDDAEAKLVLEEIGIVEGYEDHLIAIRANIESYDFEEAANILIQKILKKNQ